MTAPLGVILAGGRASRMGGGDKGRLLLDDKSLLDLVIDRLRPQVDAIALNANGDPDRFDDLGLTVLPDNLAGLPGPLAGVLAGLDWAAEQGADSIVSVASDTPFYPQNLVARLQAASGDMPLALAASRDEDGKLWRQPTFGLWPVALREDLRRALTDGLRKVVLWTDQHGAATAEFETAGFDPFFNVNTPQDLEIARAIYEDMP